jgi:hypothetical protein
VEFGNPIVGQEDLIREAIKSPNFGQDEETGDVTGWRIARDGTATFYNLVIGNPSWNIDENGNAVFQSVSATDIFLNGNSLDEMLQTNAKGVIAVTELIGGSTAGYTGTPIKFGQITIPELDPTRQYAVGLSCVHVDRGSNMAINRVTISAYVAFDATPTTADTRLFTYQNVFGPDGQAATAGTAHTHGYNGDQSISLRHTFNNDGSGGTDYNIAFFFETEESSGQCSITDADNGRIYVEDTGLLVPYGQYNLAGGGGSGTQQYTKTYSANGSSSFQSDGDNRSVSECYQGFFSGTNGNQYSMIAFPYTTIQTDLSGSTIEKVELYLNNNHTYANSGGTAVIGTHNQTSVAGNHSVGQLNDDIIRFHYDKGQAKWVTLPNSVGIAFRDNTAKGICLGPGPTTSNTYYGYYAGNGQTGEPQLRITYTK